MEYLYNKPAQIATLLVLALILAGFWFLMVFEERNILADSSVRLDSEALAVRKMEAQTGERRRIVEDYHHNLDEIRFFRDTFLIRKDERIVRISEFLAERAKARQVRLERVQYESVRNKDRDMDLYVTDLPLVGRYRDIRAFIDDIEQSDMFLIITRLNLEDDSAGRGAVRMQLSLSTYFEAGHE